MHTSWNALPFAVTRIVYQACIVDALKAFAMEPARGATPKILSNAIGIGPFLFRV